MGRLQIYVLLGLILIAIGIIFYKGGFESSTKIEVIDTTSGHQGDGDVTVEIAGEVEKPGVYKLPNNSRVDDLLAVSGGLSANANREWVSKNINKASLLKDGQKIYIPDSPAGGPSHSEVLSAKESGGYQNASGDFSYQNGSSVNINTSSLQELDKLPGIGQIYGQKIIDHRPYSNIEELLTRDVLSKSIYEKIKGMITVY